MDTILLGVGILALLIIPVVYFMAKSRKEANNKASNFITLGEEHNLTISVYDFWSPGFAIGLDTDKKKLLYVKGRVDVHQKNLVDLAEVKNCNVINEYREINGSRIIDLVALQLTYRNTNISQRLLFYNKEENLNITNELQLAEKWNAIVLANLIATTPKEVPGAVKPGR